MKKFVWFAAMPLLAFFIFTAMTPDDPPATQKKTHLRIVKIKDGEKVVIDTLLQGDDLRSFRPDSNRKFRWFDEKELPGLDSLAGDFEFKGGDVPNGESVLVMKRGRHAAPLFIHKLETEGDSGKTVVVRVEKNGPGEEDVMIWRGPRHGRMQLHSPRLPHPPLPPVPPVRHLKPRRGNIIDLGDPGIISFQKKKLSGGREKITIIRHQASETEEATFDVWRESPESGLRHIQEPKVMKERIFLKREEGKNSVPKMEIEVKEEAGEK